MMTRFKFCWLLVPVLFLSTQLCQSQPTGSFDFSFPNETLGVSLWDLAGDYNIDVPIGTAGLADASFGFTLGENNLGQLSGSSETVVTIGSDTVAGFYSIKGKVTRSGGVSHVNLLITLTGDGTISGFGTSYKLTILYNATVTADGLTGTVKTRMNIAGIGGAGATATDFGLDLPNGMDGTWGLHLDLSGLSNQKIFGSGVITLANNRTVHFDVTGSYSPSTDVAKVTLKGTNDGIGSKAAFSFLSSSQEVLKLSGKVLGQSLH